MREKRSCFSPAGGPTILRDIEGGKTPVRSTTGGTGKGVVLRVDEVGKECDVLL